MPDRDAIVQRIADRLDGLLDGPEAAEADRLIDAHPDLHARAERMRALLYAPWPVARPGPRRVRWLGYAAAFAAGVLVTLALRGRPAAAPRVEEPSPVPLPVAQIEDRRIT